MLLTIDPSISDLGWAVGQENGNLNDFGHFRTYSEWSLERRVQTIQEEIQNLVDEWDVDLIIYEWPEAFRYSHGTQGVQTFLRMGLAFGAFLTIRDIEFEQVTPREWKGQQKKEETKLLVNNRYDVDIKNSNSADAVGLYDYWVGKK